MKLLRGDLLSIVIAVAVHAACTPLASTDDANDDEQDDPSNPDGPGGGSDGGGTMASNVTCQDLPSISGLARVIACVPDGMDGKTSESQALVVALHGYTQTAEEYKDTTQWHELAARHRFYVVFPQTTGDLVGAGGKPAAWKWWRDFSPWTRTSFNQHFKPLIAVVDAMKAEHNIDPDRVFITGLSAGGYMTTLMLAVYPDVFAAGASFSGGPHNCDLKCTDSNKLQDWSRPIGYKPPTAADVINAYPTHWKDASARKPRLMLFHGALDEAVKPINLEDAKRQWTGALGIDATADNASLGEPDQLGGYEYRVYKAGDGIGVATVAMDDLGHGTPVKPGSGNDEGGNDPMPSKTATDCTNCAQDWTNTGDIYGAYWAARFFGLVTD